MNQIILVGFLPCDNSNSCELHQFGRGNSLVINWDDYGAGMQLRLRMTSQHEVACYTISADRTDGCHVCVVAWEVLAAGKPAQLDGPVVSIVSVFTSDHKNHSSRHLFHHNRRYDYARIVELQQINN